MNEIYTQIVYRPKMAQSESLPLVKLGFQVVRHISKPFAKYIADKAKESRIFRDWICIPVAQKFNYIEVKFKIYTMNLGMGRVTKVPPLSESRAVEKGSELLSEVIILTIASSILIFEYNRQSDKEQAREDRLAAEGDMIESRIVELNMTVDKQRKYIESLNKTVGHLEEMSGKSTLMDQVDVSAKPDFSAENMQPLTMPLTEEGRSTVNKAVYIILAMVIMRYALH